MSGRLVRTITNVKDVNKLADHVTSDNDIITDVSGNVYLKNRSKNYIKLSTGDNESLESDITSLKSQNTKLKNRVSELETSNWQKYKLTESNGDRISKSNVDVLSLDTGFFEGSNFTGLPHDETSRWFIDVYQTSDDAKIIKATLGYTGDVYQRTIYGESDSDWKQLTGLQDVISRIEALENADTTT